MKHKALWFTFAVAVAYCVFLGWHWLPLDHSDKELAGFVSRLWDIKRELIQQHRLPWWTPNYMSGSSYGLHHSQGLYLVPSLLFSIFCSELVAVKLTALLAIFTGGVAMFFCARYFLKPSPRDAEGAGRQYEWGAALAAVAFLFHPEQIIRAAGAEHLGIIVFLPFVPLTWLCFARLLDTGKFRDLFWCALAVAGGMWAHNKMAFVNILFLAGYIVWWVWPRRAQLATHVRTPVWLGVLSLALGAFFIVPGLMEAKDVKLFAGDPIREWQKSYAFKSLLGLVDRDGAMTRDAMTGVLQVVNNRGGVRSEEELEQVKRVMSLQADSPEKYAGIVLLVVLAVTALGNHRRENRSLFWFLVGALLVSVMCAYGFSNVWTANATTWNAIMHLEGVPSSTTSAIYVALLATGAFLVIFYRRKLTTTRKRVFAGGALLVFLFLPAFQILAMLPFFKEIRAPYVFYDITAAFLGALLVGFFVTDVLKSRAPQVVGVIAVLMLVDYWPYQKPVKDNGVPAHTLANLRAAYGSLRDDQDWVKVYALSGRYFHLLGPMLSGKPQVWEAFYNWMAPKGTGYVNTQAGGQPAMFNLMGARYVVFDKSDPNMAGAQQALQAYRQLYPVQTENEDIVIFRNPNSHAYVTGYASASEYRGDTEKSARLALALSEKKRVLIQTETSSAGKFDHSYREGDSPAFADGVLVPLQNVTLNRVNAGEIHIHLTAPSAGWLVVAESYYPNWSAEIDAKSTPVYRANCALMGLELPAGEHEIVLRYKRPQIYLVAGIVSLLTLIGAGWWAIARST